MKIFKSIGAVLAGLIFIFVTHTGVDRILEALSIFPPPELGLHTTWMLMLATAYRVALSIAGCYITARLAPSRPLAHALVLGFIGVVGSLAGLSMAISQNLSPLWYPIGLAILSLPCAWVGGKLAERRARDLS
jgi:hypothetical protein